MAVCLCNWTSHNSSEDTQADIWRKTLEKEHGIVLYADKICFFNEFEDSISSPISLTPAWLNTEQKSLPVKLYF